MTDQARTLATTLVVSMGKAAGPPRAAAEELMPLVYDELRGMARRLMARERPEHTLQPTALVHEAYLRLIDQTRVDWRGRTHFRAIGARVMRRILIDHARRHRGARRGGNRRRVTLGDSVAPDPGTELDISEVVSLHDALEQLARLDRRQARALELRFFGGLTTSEIAEVLEVSKRSVEADLMHGRAWLKRTLSRSDRP